MNPVSYFEIPVSDMDRAVAFYAAVFGYACERMHFDGQEMALLPHADGAGGISGALVQGPRHVPGKVGTRVYLNVVDLPLTLFRATQAGVAVLRAETEVGSFGSVADIEDSEGNRIALYSSLPSVHDEDLSDLGGGLFGGGGGRMRCTCC
jgi:predicted enzyme related to lactoylglutathione lyase